MKHLCLSPVGMNADHSVYVLLNESEEPVHLDGRIDAAIGDKRISRFELAKKLEAEGFQTSFSPFQDFGEPELFYRYWNEAAFEGRSFWCVFDGRFYLATNIPRQYLYFEDLDPGYILLDQEFNYFVKSTDYHAFQDGSVWPVSRLPVFVHSRFESQAEKLRSEGFLVEFF